MRIKQKEKILFLTGGPEVGVTGRRARAMAKGISHIQVKICYASTNHFSTFVNFLRQIFKHKPSIVVILENDVAAVFAALVGKLILRCWVVLDNGDVIGELARSTAMRSRLGVWATYRLENLSYKMADQLIVHGSFYKQHLESLGFRNVYFIPEGYEPDVYETFSLNSNFSHLRTQLRLSDHLTFGIMGTSQWSEKLKIPYGWDIIEALSYLRNYPIKGILICDGTGISHLKQRARELDVTSQILFLEKIPYQELPHYLNCVDICISTQTDNLVGWTRTTCKLPEYMALGKFILASEVGEASKVLPKEMLLPYHGVIDSDYPKRLASRVLEIYHNREILKLGAMNKKIASEHFDYNILRPRFASVIEDLMNES